MHAHLQHLTRSFRMSDRLICMERSRLSFSTSDFDGNWMKREWKIFSRPIQDLTAPWGEIVWLPLRTLDYFSTPHFWSPAKTEDVFERLEPFNAQKSIVKLNKQSPFAPFPILSPFAPWDIASLVIPFGQTLCQIVWRTTGQPNKSTHLFRKERCGLIQQSTIKYFSSNARINKMRKKNI